MSIVLGRLQLPACCSGTHGVGSRRFTKSAMSGRYDGIAESHVERKGQRGVPIAGSEAKEPILGRRQATGCTEYTGRRPGFRGGC